MSSIVEVLEQMIVGLKGDQKTLNRQIRILEKARREIETREESSNELKRDSTHFELGGKGLGIPIRLYNDDSSWYLRTIFTQQGCRLPNNEYYYHFHVNRTHLLSVNNRIVEKNPAGFPDTTPIFFGDYLVYCGALYERE